ncbi:MAG: penicillin acylase family protein [Bacteroidales bacterium]|nr:penicillin acylase family protein [Bacteroidales bacterium]
MNLKILRNILLQSAVVLLIASSCSGSGGNSREIAGWQKQADKITIIRDSYGIPHIYGETDADAVFGMIYAQCEDDFNRVEVNYITAMGRMAEVKGEDEIFTDLRMKLYIDPEVLKQEYAASPGWLRDLMDSWAAGINYYLQTHQDVEPLLIERFEPWMALSFSEGSIGGDIEQISVAGLRRFYSDEENMAELVAVTDAMEDDDPYADREPRGSNGISIAPQLSANGNALLLINPHTSFFFRPEVHVVSEEGLNVYGAVTWGQFFIYQGFNDKCGWMHTSTRADIIDYYSESVVEQDGNYFYQHGEDIKSFTTKEITVKYIDGEELKEKSFTAYYSHHGPVVRKQDDNWITVSLMVEREKALTQSYMRTKALSYEEFKETMRLRTNSSNNTVYADGDGNIAYFHGNFIPVRDESFDWSGIVDGSDPATDWKGLHEVEDMVTLLNPENGWIQNCNSTPFTAAGEYSPDPSDYPAYMAPDAENPRGIHAVMVLEGESDFTVDKLIETAYDSYLPAFDKSVPALVKAFDRIAAVTPAVKRKMGDAADVLRNWDFRWGNESVATSLAVYWGDEVLSRMRGYDIPSGESVFDFLATSVEDEVLVDALDAAVTRLGEDFGTWETPWGEINRYQRLTGDIVQQFDDNKPSLPVPFTSSRWGSLASFGARTYPGTVRMYGTSGNSFVAAVEFGDTIVAKSILAGGISGDPDSPHFDDQAEMYSKGIFKDVLFYRTDIEADAERTYNPGK